MPDAMNPPVMSSLSDVFSEACILYQRSCGKVAFSAAFYAVFGAQWVKNAGKIAAFASRCPRLAHLDGVLTRCQRLPSFARRTAEAPVPARGSWDNESGEP